MTECVNECKKIDAVGVDDAFCLMKHARELGFRGHINIQGSVIAISAIFRVKEDYVIFVKLKGNNGACISVLALQRLNSHGEDDGDGEQGHGSLPWEQLGVWKEKLEVNKGAVISKLKLMVAFKGTDKEQTVFRADKGSVCVVAEGSDVYNDLTLEDWFYEYLRKIVSTRQISKALPKLDEPVSLENIVGTISSCKDAIHGVYELDGTKRLLLTRIPSETGYRDIRPSAKVCVSFHHAPMLFNERMVIFGCIHSSIQILQPSDEPCEIVPFQSSKSAIASLLSNHAICNRQLYRIVELERSIVQRFELQRNRYRAGLILHTLLSKPLPSSKQILQPRKEKRNIMEEFLLDTCTCENEDSDLPCSFPTVSDLLAMPLANTLTDAGNDGKHGWSATCLKSSDLSPPQVLLGVLCLNKTSGHLELQDNNGSVSAVLSDDGAEEGDHICSDEKRSSCCFHVGVCPYAQTWLMGHVVRIDKYELVEETFSNVCDSNSVIRYIQFSSRDVVTCDEVSVKSKPFVPPSASGGKEMGEGESPGMTGGEKTVNRERVRPPCDISVHADKPAVRSKLRNKAYCPSDLLPETNHNIDSLDQRLDSHDGTSDISGAKWLTMSEKTSLKTTCQLSKSSQQVPSGSSRLDEKPNVDWPKIGGVHEIMFVLMKEGLQFRQISPTGYELFFNVDGLIVSQKKGATGTGNTAKISKEGDTMASSSSSLQNCASQRGEMPGGSYTLERITLNISGAQASLYEVLHPNCAYTFSTEHSIGKNVFMSSLPTGLRGKRITKTYILNECKVDRLGQNEDPGMLPGLLAGIEKAEAEVLTVEQLLKSRQSSPAFSNQGSNQPLVSVKGMVVSKSMKENERGASSVPKKCIDSLGLSPAGSKFTIILSDLHSSDEVYLELQTGPHPYVLGLLPGAVVIASQVAKRQANGFNYLQLVAVSSIRILKRSTEILTRQSKKINPPQMSLFQIWNADTIPEIQFRCVVFVSVILKLTLTPICMHCSSQFHHGKCTGRGCGSTAGILKSEALLICDDGTSKGLVFCKGDTVQGVLRMSGEAWLELEEYLLINGGFYYDKGSHSDESSPVHQMLQDACSYNHLCCSFDMCLKPAVRMMRSNDCKGLTQIKPKDVALKTVSCGQTRFETHQLPMLKFDCLSIQPEK